MLRYDARDCIRRRALVWRRLARRLRASVLPPPMRCPASLLTAAALMADCPLLESGSDSSGDDDDDGCFPCASSGDDSGDDGEFPCESSDDGAAPALGAGRAPPSDGASAFSLLTVPPWARRLYWRYARAAQVCLATPAGQAARLAEVPLSVDGRCDSPTSVLLALGRAMLEVRAAADSGSPFSFISSVVFAALLRGARHGRRIELLPPRPIVASACGANGGRLNIKGRCLVQVDVDGVRTTAEFHVMEGMAVPAILGNDHLLPWGALMDWPARTLALRTLGVTLPLHGLPDAAPGYGELLDVVAVEEAVVPLFHERMVQVCLMTPAGRRVNHPLVGDLLHADFAQLAPRSGAAAFPLGVRTIPMSNQHTAPTPDGHCDARRVLPGERVAQLRVRVALPTLPGPAVPADSPAVSPPRGPRPAFAGYGPRLRG